jgi:hypothetical protein
VDHDHIDGPARALAAVEIPVDREMIDDIILVIEGVIKGPLLLRVVGVAPVVGFAGAADDQHGGSLIG